MNLREIKQSAANLQINKDVIDNDRILKDAEVVLEKSVRNNDTKICITSRSKLPKLVWLSGLAATFLIISSLIACFVLSIKNADLRDELARRDIATTPIKDSVTINFYLKEHQDFIAQQASLNSTISQPIQINQDDIMYYELFGNQSEFMSPGMIIRGSSSQQEIDSSETPSISNGHTLTLSEARDTADFNLVAPLWLRLYYRLDQIRNIEGRDALQLLYNDGINSISLFEQPLDGQNGLSHQDYREYAVYNNQGEGRGTILAWRDDTLSYVLIGNVEISQLMDMAQSISARE